MTVAEIQSLIVAMGFAPATADEKLFTKSFPSHAGYSLSVDFEHKRLSYGSEIKVNHQGILTFADSENFVVLECVNRLLEKGYSPKHLELERMFPIGHNPVAGRADITVYDRKGKALFVIECKTFGQEYESAKRRLQTSVGQLFTYLQQDRNTRFICLYASRFYDGNLEYENLVVRIKDSDAVLKEAKKKPEYLAYLNAAEAKDFHRVWREQYALFSTPNGIFDDGVAAYNPDLVPIKRKDLKPFSEEEGRKFFNEFSEILRHNNISDNSNAFNRILSLLLCKIVDEQKSSDTVTDFQIQDSGEPGEAIQDRLQRLYAEGMEKFLKEQIIYISETQIDDVLKDFPKQAAKKMLRQLFIQQKYYSNNEFAFKEVHNEKLFNENAKVLVEILRLLQYKQFRYDRKDTAEYKKQKRYLGEFFELLLDAGYKQTAGQFFTPLPIAKFIVSSLPIENIIRNKIEKKQTEFLPLLIDYACGSAHFLVEAIEQIQEFVDNLRPEYDAQTNSKLLHWQKTDWTKGFLFGIEKDYRLARTAKLACFMNGDGETSIILGDGLEDYRKTDPGFPDSFDILVANPPYSIKDFKAHTLKNLKNNEFELAQYLTDSASEIETLFVERTAQLLHTNGVSGVILPSSILSNTGIYTKTREILLRHFEIRAIVELGSNTFMATGTNTVILFLKKRDERAALNADYLADDFILHNQKRDNDFADTGKILTDYARAIGFTRSEYQSFLKRKPVSAVTESDWYKDYRAWFANLAEIRRLQRDVKFLARTVEEQADILENRFFAEAKNKEKDKFEFYFLCYGQRTLIVRAFADGKEEKQFLGYEFSRKRGFEGIRYFKENGKHKTALYDEENTTNPDKLNTIVREMVSPELYDYRKFNSIKEPRLPANLEKQARVVALNDCFDFSRIEFEKQISLSLKKSTTVQGKWKMVKLGEVTTIYNGGTPDTKVAENWDGGIAWATLVDTKSKYLYSTKRTISTKGLKNSNAVLLPVDTVIFSSRATIGEVTIAKTEVTTNQGYKNFVCDTQVLDPEYLYVILKHEARNIADLASGMTYAEISKEQIANFRIPLPPIDVQKELLKKIAAVEKAEDKNRTKIEELRSMISDYVKGFERSVNPGAVCQIGGKKVAPTDLNATQFYVGLEHIESNTGNLAGKENALSANLKSTKNEFKPGDVLYGKLRPYLNKVYIAEFDGVCSTDILVLQSQFPTVLKYALLNEDFVNQTSEMMKGTSLPRLQVKDFMTVKMHYPQNEQTAESYLQKLSKQILEAEKLLHESVESRTNILASYLY